MSLFSVMIRLDVHSAADLAAKFKISSDQSLEILRRLSGSLWSALMKTPDHIPIDKALIQLLSS
jgi:hypothetical protein